MGRVLVVVGVALVLLIGLFAFVAGVGDQKSGLAIDNLLSESVTRAVTEADSDGPGRVDLRDLTLFSWDEVLVVAPGTSQRTVSNALGREWSGAKVFGDNELLLFLRAGRVVRWCDVRIARRWEGFPTPIARLPAERAQLQVEGQRVRPG